MLHRSDRWPAPVRPVVRVGQAGGYSSHTTSVPESLSDFSRPWNKNTPKNTTYKEEEPFKPKQNNSKQTKNKPAAPRPKDTRVKQFTRGKSHKWHNRSDRSHTPLRPVKPRQLGMNSTRGATPQIQLPISRIAPRICARLWG
jgi:hypothetical protein